MKNGPSRIYGSDGWQNVETIGPQLATRTLHTYGWSHRAPEASGQMQFPHQLNHLNLKCKLNIECLLNPFQIYSEPIPNPIPNPIPKHQNLKKHIDLE